MTSIALFNYFDLFQRGGFTQQQSEAQTRVLEQVILEIKQEIKEEIKQEFDSRDLGVRGDITLAKKELELSIEKVRTDLEKFRYDALKFTVWTGVGVIASLGGLMISLLGKGFHWF